MKAIFVSAVFALCAVLPAQAQMATATCKVQATDKKLAGAAQTSFMKKCQSDATMACEADSKSKKLAGAAKNSHMKKCVADAVGT